MEMWIVKRIISEDNFTSIPNNNWNINPSTCVWQAKLSSSCNWLCRWNETVPAHGSNQSAWIWWLKLKCQKKYWAKSKDRSPCSHSRATKCKQNDQPYLWEKSLCNWMIGIRFTTKVNLIWDKALGMSLDEYLARTEMLRM